MTTTRWILSLLTLLVAGCAASMTDDHPSKWIRVPQTLDREEVLWEGPLEQDIALGGFIGPPFDEKELREYQKAHGLPETGKLDDVTVKALSDTWNKVESHPPIVSIGRPQTWPLPMVLPPEKMSPLIQTRLKEADFYLIQLFCSFRPTHGETWIESARFNVSLLPDLMGRQPIALDLIPTRVTQEVKRQAKFTLAPTLKFQEVEVQGPNIEWGIEYRELEPIFIGTGAGEKHATWTYQTATGIRGVEGGKGMYLIVEAPKGMATAYARLKLEAQIRAEGIIRPWSKWTRWRPPKQAEENVRLW